MGMKRLVVTGPKQASFEDVPIPSCPPDGLLVRANVTTVSTGSEIRVFRWLPVDEAGEWIYGGVPFPKGAMENGYSMVGEVIEKGSDVTNFSTGDRVFVGATHKEYTVTSPTQAYKIPDSLSDEHAVFMNILNVGQIGLRNGNPTLGENVAIVGLGVIGLSTLAFCNAMGLRTVGLDLAQNRREVAKKMGAQLVMDPTLDRVHEDIIQHFDGIGADLVIEAASNWRAVRTGLELVLQDGRIVVVARHVDVPDYNIYGHPYMNKRVTIRSSYGYGDEGDRWDLNRTLKLSLSMLAEGKLSIGAMITHEFEWSELPEVYSRLDKGDTDILGAIIRWR